jgi:hypothetical protein
VMAEETVMVTGAKGNLVKRDLTMLTFSPANAEAAQLYKDNTKEYERRVKVSHPFSNPFQLETDPSANGRVILGRYRRTRP